MGPEAREQGTSPYTLVRMYGVSGDIQKLCCGVISNGELHVERDSLLLFITISIRAHPS